MSAPKVERRVGLARYLSPTDVWAIAFGCIIGWGAFVMPGTTFLPTAGPGGTVIAMIVSAVIMLMIGTSYSFLMTRRPTTGGVYAYTKEVFGRDHAFLCSWFLSLSYMSIVFLNATALFVVSRTLLGDTLQVGYRYTVAGYEVYLGEVALSAAALLLIGILFILSKPFLQKLQTILAVILLIGSVIITVICLPHFDPGHLFSSFGGEGDSRVSMIMTIVLLSPWAFVGFDVISLETVHFDFPIKKSWKIIAVSIIMGGFVYSAMSLVSISSVPDGFVSWQEYIASIDDLSGVETVPTFYAAREIMGAKGLAIIGITALAAIFTGIIGAYRATTRVLSTMAEDHIVSERFSKTSFCIAFIMVISVIISFLGRNALEWFVELTTFGAIVGFGYTSASAYKLSKLDGNRKVMVTSITGTLITGAFALVQMIPMMTSLDTMGAQSFLMLAVWCMLGFLFYWKTMSQGSPSEHSGFFTSSTVLFSLLLYSLMMWFGMRVMGEAPSEDLKGFIVRNGAVFMLLTFAGLGIMLYVQNMLLRRQERLEREKIYAEEKNNAKSQFLFNMSHDIRTPMNAIIGFTKLAVKENREPVVGDYLNKIDASSKHLLDLIDDILEMSRIESGNKELEYETTDITGLMDEINDLFREQMQNKGLDLSVSYDNVRDRYVSCDRRALNRVLLNIISNAYKFTPEGGRIKAELKEVPQPEGRKNIYEFIISDTGIGMSAEFAEKMFTAFERERTSTASGIQGTGLGLAITKSMVDLMGGTINVKTSPGEGTEFTIRLEFDKAEDDSVSAPDRIEAYQTESGSKAVSDINVLLVEDNEINREIAVMVLKDAGFIVDVAGNGREAVDRIADSAPGRYDLILMDIQMPVMNGYEAAEAIRAMEDPDKAGIPIIAMTANAFREDEKAAEEAGMQAHIAKPLDIAKMMDTINRVMENRDR